MAKEDFNLKDEYDKLKNKYKLPEFDYLNNEFEFNIDKKDFLLRAIRRRMNDKLISFCRIIESIIFPGSQNPFANYESSFFDESKKREFMNLHRKMMVFERQSLLLDVSPNENGDSEYIKSLVKEWPAFKNYVHEIVYAMQKSWESEANEDGEEYFG